MMFSRMNIWCQQGANFGCFIHTRCCKSKVHTSIPPFFGGLSTVEVGGMNAGRVEGVFETCVLVGKFIGVLESFNPPLS
jgi:hypothetical protein